ncbi:DUF4118 domain-containing protein [Caballeronia sp. LZ034LL]|uniref:DUF4118 domain-containing protein n=1 Tax=Caballeronia sp. LZ034LL TaxID=3038567 RepID=UPI002862CA7E|nr:DUF4118 domain-containing protein [Caballeronia sp. LZ034LL]MDR5834571.1 DUF4118 domain-containing protein [Caballeronia sp. LZ034LL]
MQVKNSERWASRGRRRWIIATVALFTAFAVRLILHPLLGPIMPQITFLLAAVLVEYFCGLGPAVLVMLTGLFIAIYMFVPPYASIGPVDQRVLCLMLSYLLIAILVITLIERLKRAQYRGELLASVAYSRYEMLLRGDNERLLTRRANNEMHRMLHHLSHFNRSLILIKALDPATRSRSQTAVAAATDALDDPPFSIGMTFGAKHLQAHQEDLARVSDRLAPGYYRMRFMSGSDWQASECVCERFATPTGEFLVLRTDE